MVVTQQNNGLTDPDVANWARVLDSERVAEFERQQLLGVLNDPAVKEYLKLHPEKHHELSNMHREAAEATRTAHVNALTALEDMKKQAAERGDSESVKKIDTDIQELNDNYNKNPHAHPPAADEMGAGSLKSVANFGLALGSFSAILGGIAGMDDLQGYVHGGNFAYAGEMDAAGTRAAQATSGMESVFSSLQSFAQNFNNGPDVGLHQNMGMGMTGQGFNPSRMA